MKQMKLTVILLLFFGQSFAQDDDEPDFYYEPLSDIKSTGFMSVGIEPLAIGIQGSHLTMAIGGDLRLSNLNERFSVEGHLGYKYVNYSFDGNKLRYRSLDIDDKKALNIEGLFGYTLGQNKEKREMTIRLKHSGNTETVSNFPCLVVTSYVVRAGYYSYGYFMRGEAGSNRYEIFQNAQNMVVGFVRKKSIDSKFKTDKYGIVSKSVDSEIYVDFMINVGNEFPQIDELFYLDSTYPNEVSDEKVVPFDEQNTFRDEFFRIPVGVRVGWRTQPYQKWGFYSGAEIGVFPGSYSSFLSLSPVVAKMSIGFNFLNRLK